MAQIIGCQRFLRQAGLRLAKRVHGGGVPATLRFDKAEHHPRRPVLRVLSDALAIAHDQRVERAALDVVAVHAVERRAAPRILFENADKALHDPPVALFLGRQRRRRSLPR